MSTYIIAQSTPLPGKVNLVETRMRTVLGVMAQKGAKETRLFRNLIGNMAGDFGMGAKFDNFHEALSTFDEVRHDPMFAEVSKQRWDNPAGQMRGPFIMRDIYGAVDISAPVHVIRTYQMSRNQLPQMTEIITKIDNLSPEYRLAAVVPVLGSEMDMVHGIYHFESLPSAGKIIDEVGMSSEFQELVNRANELGTLVRAGLNIKM